MQTDLLNQIANTTSRTKKEQLLATVDKLTQTGIAYALDPYRTYGITLNHDEVLHIQGSGKTLSYDVWWKGFRELLDKLAARTLTGGAASTALMTHFTRCASHDDVEWALRVLHKDLRCGVSIKTVTKVFPGLISPFEVALAKAWEGKPLPGVGYVEPKLDGLRVTVVNGIARTRNGNEVSATDAMLDELASMLGKRRAKLTDWVFDGEFIGDGTFEETVSAARKSGSENRGLVYNVFDIISIDEWMTQQTRAFSYRRHDLEHYIQKGGEFVQPVQSHRVKDVNATELQTFCESFMADGYEGAMYKTDAPYRFKRSADLLKIKRWETTDAKIVGFEIGKGKYEGMLGALIVKLADGTQVNVGTGFSDADRESIWGKRSWLMGKTAELQYQNKTAKGSLRFPVFVKFRHDK